MIQFPNCEIAARQPFISATCMAAVVALGASALIATPAVASPPSNITSAPILATGDLDETININHDRIKFQTKGPVDVRVQELVFGANSYSGWHHHPGVVIVTVKVGLITTVQADCSTKVYGPGSPNGSVFVEGHDTPMEARSTLGATVYATYIVPNGAPFRVDDTAPTCSSATTFRTPTRN